METVRELSEKVLALMNGPVENKVDWVLADSWVHTPVTKAAFQWMAYMCRVGSVIRPPCLQIIADGGMGKTAVLLAFASLYPVQHMPEDPLRLQRPVLYAECTADVSGVAGVRRAILKAAWPEASYFTCSEHEIDSTLRAQGVRLLLLDEFGELMKSGAAGHRKALSELKRIGNTSRVSIVAATVTNLAHVLDVDQQFASRFKRKIRIDPWSLSQDLRNFVFGLECNLPFLERSSLDGPRFLPWIAQHCDGNTKEIVDVVRLAALHALTDGASHIRMCHLKAAVESDLPPGIVLPAAA